MNSAEISAILKHDACTTSYFRRTLPSDHLKNLEETVLPAIFVVNTDPSYKSGQHWVAFYFSQQLETPVEFFDSFGFQPSSAFKKFIYSFGHTKFICGNEQYQSFYSTACGQYCVYFSLLKSRGVSFRCISNCFDVKNKDWNDSMVTMFVNKHFNVNLKPFDYDFIIQKCIAYNQRIP